MQPTALLPPVFRIGEQTIERESRRRLEIPIARLPSDTWLSLPLEVICGRAPGPRLWLSAAVHGDELNGVEIVQRVLERIQPPELRGTLVAAPVVNVFGFINQSRYLPDRRDLNRCFPGTARGSLGSRLAHIFMSEVVKRCTHGIDLHTGSHHRENLPQVRANLQHDETRYCAEAFGAPVMIDAQLRDGSLRHAGAQLDIPVLVYEAGEPLRFDYEAIELGVRGILRVMTALGMRKSKAKARRPPPVMLSRTVWVRAGRGGVLHLDVRLGESVRQRQVLGVIKDAFGADSSRVRAPADGIVIAQNNHPLVHQGDAVVHLGLA